MAVKHIFQTMEALHDDLFKVRRSSFEVINLKERSCDIVCPSIDVEAGQSFQCRQSVFSPEFFVEIGQEQVQLLRARESGHSLTAEEMDYLQVCGLVFLLPIFDQLDESANPLTKVLVIRLLRDQLYMRRIQPTYIKDLSCFGFLCPFIEQSYLLSAIAHKDNLR